MSIVFVGSYIAAVLAVVVTKFSFRQYHKIVKPLPMILLLALLALQPNGWSGYKIYVFSAFVFSLAGDVLISLNERYFLYALISFLIAHLLFIAAFFSGVDLSNQWFVLPAALLPVWLYFYLKPGLGKYNIPVAVYAAVIGGMLFFSWNRFWVLNSSESIFVFCGAVLFVISDSVLGVNKFRVKFIFAEPVILTIYFGAQALFYLSVCCST